MRAATLAGLAIAFLGPLLFVVIPDRVFGVSPSLHIQIVIQFLYCGLVPLLLYIVLRHERLTVASIGLRRPDWTTVAWGLVLCALSMYVLPLMTAPLVALAGTAGLQAGLARLSIMPMWFRMVVAITGGAIEETLYRDYAVERLGALTGRAWLGGTIAAIVFGLSHALVWGIGFALAADLPFGILMTAFYLWRRDLLANILAHSTSLAVAMATTVP